jgi:hypothetical protein
MDSDETTVLWDFADPTGAANPNTIVTKLGATLDLGTVEPEVAVYRTAAGGARRTHGVSDPPVEFTVLQMASASTYDNLVAGLGQLAEWLRDPPGPLKWTQGGAARFMDLLGAPSLPALLRGQGTAGIVATRKSSLGPIPIRLVRKPYMRAAVVTTTPTAVANDPATAGGRLLPVTITGDLPTPVAVTSQMNAASAVQRVLLAHHKATSANITDLTDETAWAQLEASGRGWTRTTGTDTSTTVTDANASPGTGVSAARTTYATNPTVMARRLRLTRTTKLASLRGHWDVWVRVKASFATSRHVIGMRWGLGSGDAANYTSPEVVHDLVAVSALGFVELKVGSIRLPPEGTVAALTIEFWARRETGSGNLDWDLMFLTPRAGLGTVVVPGGWRSTTLGVDMTAPPAVITGDPTWAAGDTVGDSARLRTDNVGVGVGPNAGTVLPAGRHRATFTVQRNSLNADHKLRVVKVTATSAETAVLSFTGGGGAGSAGYALEFDADGTSAYQAQVVMTTHTSGSLFVQNITQEFIPSLASTEQIRTDPGTRYSVERLDASGNVSGYLENEGELPMMLLPGTNLVFTRADDVTVAGYVEPSNIRTRSQTITLAYAPRYAL